MTWIIGTILAAASLQGFVIFLTCGFWPGVGSGAIQGALSCIVAVVALSESRYVPRNHK